MEKETNRKHIVKKGSRDLFGGDADPDIFFKYNYELFFAGGGNRTGNNRNGIEQSERPGNG